ncbi:hypothetical protein R3I93_002554 [Phoxinus phoxinus]|uniref:Uncharacterized protein n=1 Tax=Phoxinus phoxinus TaxID=58324 RepID=A0AAN9DFD3_9TELE
MPPKKEEIEEIKKSLDFLSEEISTVSKQQKTIIDLMGEIKELKKQNEEKDKRITSLECHVADMEQHYRMNVIVVSGLETRPRSYARAVTTTGSGELIDPDMDSVKQQVTAFFHSKGISICHTDIEACHPLPQKNKTDQPALLIRFTNRKNKNALLRQGKNLRGTDVYVNEHLTKKNADIGFSSASLGSVPFWQSTWTTNCKVFIKLNGSPEDARVLSVRHIEELDKYQ